MIKLHVFTMLCALYIVGVLAYLDDPFRWYVWLGELAAGVFWGAALWDLKAELHQRKRRKQLR